MRHALHLEPGNEEAAQAAGRPRVVVEAEIGAGGITGVLDAVSLMRSDSSVSEDQPGARADQDRACDP